METITHTQTNSSPADRDSGGYLEGAGPRIAGSSSGAAGTWDDARSPRSCSPVEKNPEDQLGSGGRELEGSSSRAIRRWENPDSAGGLAQATGRGRRPTIYHKKALKRQSVRQQPGAAQSPSGAQPGAPKALSGRLAMRVKRGLRFFHLACMTPRE